MWDGSIIWWGSVISMASCMVETMELVRDDASSVQEEMSRTCWFEAYPTGNWKYDYQLGLSRHAIEKPGPIPRIS